MTTRIPRLPADFWRLWRLLFANRLLSFAVPLLAPFLLTARDAPTGVVAVSVALFGIGAIAGGMLGAWFGTRYGHLNEVTLCFVATGVLVQSLVWTPVMTIPVICLALGVGASFGRPGMTTLMVTAAGPAKRVPALAMMGWATNLATPAAMLLASLGAVLPFRYLLIAEAVVCLGCAVWSRTFRDAGAHGRPAEASRPRSRLIGLVGQLRYVVAANIAVFALLFHLSGPLAVAVLESGLTASDYALLLLVNGALVAILQPLTAQLVARFNTLAWIVTVDLAVAAVVAAMGAWSALPSFVVIVVVLSIAQVVLATVTQELFATRVGEAQFGQAMGIYTSSLAVAAAIGPAIGIALLAGHPTLYLAWCGLLALVAVAGHASKRRDPAPVLTEGQHDDADLASAIPARRQHAAA